MPAFENTQQHHAIISMSNTLTRCNLAQGRQQNAPDLELFQAIVQSALAELDRLAEERGRIGTAFGRLSGSDAVLKARPARADTAESVKCAQGSSRDAATRTVVVLLLRFRSSLFCSSPSAEHFFDSGGIFRACSHGTRDATCGCGQGQHRVMRTNHDSFTSYARPSRRWCSLRCIARREGVWLAVERSRRRGAAGRGGRAGSWSRASASTRT